MEKLINRYKQLDKWANCHTNKTFKKTYRESITRHIFPFDLVYTGKDPNGNEYIIIDHVPEKLKKSFPLRTVFLIDRQSKNENPTIVSVSTSTIDSSHKIIDANIYTIFSNHSIDRYCQRHLKNGGLISDKELTSLVKNLRNMTFKSENITQSIVGYFGDGLFLGSIEVCRFGCLYYRTFIADHNLYSNQSLLKRNLNEFMKETEYLTPRYKADRSAKKQIY